MAREIIALFLCGAFGGISPTLLELAGLARNQDFPGSGFYVAMCIFAAIGGGVALVYREKVPHKAFMLGVAAPALIVAAGTVIDSPRQQARVSPPLLDLHLSNTVYAQELGSAEEVAAGASAAKSSERRLRVVCSGFSRPGNCTVEFLSGSGLRRKTLSVVAVGSPGGEISIPSGAEAVIIGDGYSQAQPLVLPEGQMITIRAQKRDTFFSGLYSAFGMDNRAEEAKEARAVLESVRVPPGRPLRSRETTLSLAEIREVIEEEGFYNPETRQPGAFHHSYRTEVVGSERIPVIVDDVTGLMWRIVPEHWAFAEAEDLVRARNRERLGGFEDWRIPTVEELLSILTGPDPNRETGYLPSAFQWKAREVWSRDQDKYSSNRWYVDFSRGAVDNRNTAQAPAEVLLVRTM